MLLRVLLDEESPAAGHDFMLLLLNFGSIDP